MTISWPQGVTDQTLLPFRLWRVLDALTVHQQGTAAGVGAALRGAEASPGAMPARSPAALPGEAQLQEALAMAQQYAARAQRQERVVNGALVREVTGALVSCIGPMGQLMVEDALEDLPAPVRLSVLLRTLGGELQAPERQSFGRQLQSRGLL